MNADEYLLKLPSIAINSRENLPEKSGIYYVVDEKYVIWYIGKAKNLRNRWVGDSHHRIYQLQKQRKKQFTIHYELVSESMLDTIEVQRIEHYNPQLNGTRVSSKNLQPTETLLRKTLMTVAPYSFILGVEPPRKEDINLIKDCRVWRDNWRVHKSVIPLKIIHICVNLTELEKLVYKDSLAISFLKKVFRKNPKYANNWVVQVKNDYACFGRFVLRRLLVNGTAIEVYEVRQEVASLIQDYRITQLAGVDIKTVTDVSLEQIKNKCLLNPIAGLYLNNDSNSSSYAELCNRAIKRLNPYQEDVVKIIFNDSIDTSKILTVPTEVKPTQEINNGLSVRLANLAKKKEYLNNLLIERGLDLDRYQVKEYLEHLPKDNNHYEGNRSKKMFVFVKSFLYSDLRSPIYSSTMIYGKKGTTYQSKNTSNSLYEEVYLAVAVDRAFWLLLENYLSDFVKVTLNENEGYIQQYYISPRKILKPSILSITLNGKWKSDIPIGPRDSMSYYEVLEIIKKPLQNSGIPKLRFTSTIG